jgi:hypothetical protein
VWYTGRIKLESGIELATVCAMIARILSNGNVIFIEVSFWSEVVTCITLYAVHTGVPKVHDLPIHA